MCRVWVQCMLAFTNTAEHSYRPNILDTAFPCSLFNRALQYYNVLKDTWWGWMGVGVRVGAWNVVGEMRYDIQVVYLWRLFGYICKIDQIYIVCLCAPFSYLLFKCRCNIFKLILKHKYVHIIGKYEMLQERLK